MSATVRSRLLGAEQLPGLWWGSAIGVAGTTAVALPLGPIHQRVGRATPSLLLVVPVVAAGFVGGMAASILTALAAGVVLLLVFIPPAGTLTVDVPADAVALTL